MVHYSIIEGDPLGNFTVDHVTGLLRPTTPIDFEQLLPRRSRQVPDNDTQYDDEELELASGPGLDLVSGGAGVQMLRLVVQAQDLGVPPMWAQALVTIYVQDINDHAPLFEQNFYAKSIPEDLPGGSSVLQVKAWDADGSVPNNRVVYRIQHGAEDKFVIEADSGVISVAHGATLDPDRSDPRTTLYALLVVALDGGIGASQMRAVVPVNISISDVNNKAPVFQEPGTIRVRENTPVSNISL